MIRSFTVTNYRDESLTCELADPSKEGFVVAGIDGLGPTKATVNVTDISSIDGGLFNFCPYWVKKYCNFFGVLL